MMVCLLMQAVAVFPHHHHAHLFCLHDDWEQCEGCSHGHHEEEPALPHECDGGCVTHIQCRSQQIQAPAVTPDYTFFTFLYTFTTRFKLPDTDIQHLRKAATVFIERLHSVPIRNSRGLRAPPQRG